MQNILNTLLKTIIIILMVFIASATMAQGPPPPPDSGSNTGSNQLGGNAPIGGGLFILLGLGAAYGGRKLYQLKKESLEE